MQTPMLLQHSTNAGHSTDTLAFGIGKHHSPIPQLVRPNRLSPQLPLSPSTNGQPLIYVLQSGTLKGFTFSWLNASLRSDLATQADIDENRLVVSYSLPLL